MEFMENELLNEVQQGLRANKTEWSRIADEVPEVSRSWCYQVATGKYKSSPAYKRLQAVAAWLRRNSEARA